MRSIVALVLGGALALVGCGSDATSGGAGSGGSGGSAGTGGAGGMMGGEAPVITSVTSTPALPCANGISSDYTITIAATDAETPAEDLAYSGGVPQGCSGNIDDRASTISCVNGGDYRGAVAMVEDPQGNIDTLSFTITRCTENVTEP